MNEIWANRIAAGTKTWDEVPASRKNGVKSVLAARVEAGTLTSARYAEITGEEYENPAAV